MTASNGYNLGSDGQDTRNGTNGTHSVNGTNGVNGHSNGNGNGVNGTSVHDDELREPMAIIGCGMRLPGGIRDGEAFWDFLINKKEGRCRVPADRYNIEAFYGPGKQGRVASEYGHFLDDIDLAEIDAHFWSMTAAEIKDMDPQQRLALEVVYEALQNSGTTDYEGKKIGAYFGIFGEDWPNMQTRETLETTIYRVSGYGDFALANRVSYEFGFQGPSMVIRTACSSSLTGLHEACMAIQGGECESAIVGGTSIILNPHMTTALSSQSVMSPDGRCKTFDAGANGYARAEGVVAIHIKKLSDAIRNNDPIRAVIKSTCLNSDGRTSNMSQPSLQSHAALIRRSHKLAGITDVCSTAMIECHGTGTLVGDPVEASAVADVFGEKGIFIGSVKPNVGHSEGASGVTSVIKMMLALEKRQIPPNRNFEVPNPRIPFKEAGLVVPLEVTEWPQGRAERVGVNSFGIGGANAHVLIESAHEAGVKPAGRLIEGQSDAETNKHALLMFSANSPEALQAVVKSHGDYLKAHPDRLQDLAYTLGARRQPLSQRTHAIVSQDALDEPLKTAPAERTNAKSELVYVFTGQGAQYAGMGSALIQQNAIFRNTLERLDRVLQSRKPPAAWSLVDELCKPEADSRLGEAEFSQPCCTAIQIGLVDVLSSWGVSPSKVVGHSSGEIGGAYASGAISADDAIRIAYYRGIAGKELIAMKDSGLEGGMAAIGLGRQEVSPFLQPGVMIACENSPDSTTLSGDLSALFKVMESIKAKYPDALVRQLRVDCAYHSHHMKRVSQSYSGMISDLKPSSPRVPFFSSVTAGLLDESTPLDAKYWANNLTSPVLFSQAVAEITKITKAPGAPRAVFLEIGPHSALGGPLRQIFRAGNTPNVSYTSTLTRKQEADIGLLNLAGNLFQQGLKLDFESIVGSGSVLVDLPTYPWQRSGNYWSESRVSKAWRFKEHPHHDILGSRIGEVGGAHPAWRNLLSLDDVPWIRDHVIGEDIIFPGAGYIAMAGESVRQLFGATDYTVRDVTIGNALIMHEGTSAELITTVKPFRLTNSLESAWQEFSIYSLRNDTWVKHAFGQVRAGSSYEEPVPEITGLQREVNSDKWYQVMKRVGLNYEGRFHGLENITAHVTEHQAVAEVDNDIDVNGSPYALAPSTIDCAFQLFSAAAFQGLSRQFSSLAVPTFIGELYVKQVAGRLRVATNAKANRRGALQGDAVGVADGEVVLRLKDLRLFPIDQTEDARGNDPHAAAEFVWRPDVNIVDKEKLMKPRADSNHLSTDYGPLADRMSLTCMVETSVRLAGLTPTQDFLLKYRDWCDKMRQRAVDNTYPNVQDGTEIANMTSEQREEIIELIHAKLKDSEVWPVAAAAYRIFHACREIFSGETNPLSLLLEDDILSGIYDLGRITDVSDFFFLSGHYKPKLRILEIGAGTGGTTNTILPKLIDAHGARMYYSYTYTDISTGFFVAAKDRFKDFDAIDYKILDITVDPVEQGYEPHTYDIIIASNVLHATPYVTETLKNVHKLLIPGGRLFLQELNTKTKWINYIMGTLSGWWLGEDDGRLDEPYMSPQGWDERLRAAGFQGIEALHFDQEFNSNIIATPVRSLVREKRVTLVCMDSAFSSVGQLQRVLVDKGGISSDIVQFGSDMNLPAGQDIVALLDVERPFIHDMTEAQYENLKKLVEDFGKGGILWLTGLSSIKCQDPRYAMSLGLARTVRNETEIEFGTLELESFDEVGWGAVVDVLGEFLSRPLSDDPTASEFKPNLEWAYCDGMVHVGRFHWTSVNDELARLGASGSGRQLDIGKHGLLSSLYWKQFEPETLTGNQVQIQTRNIGLNFKDVLISMGIVDGQGIDGDDGLGCEGGGVIEKVGPDVKEFAVGDRVMFFGFGTFTTSFTAFETMCVKIPDDLSFEDAATMTAVYMTVIYSLMDKAHLEEGQSVLIHSACGGVGMAAIQISRMIGAEVYCTVGSEDKVQHLVDNFGIPRERIFHSRDLTFRRDVLAATNSKGVDVVLNSLSGELLHASWQCVAEFGTMIEIGKRDLIGKGALALDVFELNRSYFGIDLAHMGYERPKLATRLLRQIMTLYGQGHIKPIGPVTRFEASAIEDAMRFMQKGSHIGKVVINMPQQVDELDSTQSSKAKLHLDEKASYVLVGGLGGVGQALAVWMAEAGAGELVFMSRSAEAPGKYASFEKELNALGCSVVMVSGSASNKEDVARALDRATRPVKGVMHMSMVLNDSAFAGMPYSNWRETADPKVLGAWNIHEVLKEKRIDIDFLLLISSVSGFFGQRGQANYAAANTFLDAFSQYRQRQGLPCATIDLGVVEDIGYVSRNPRILNHFHTTSTHVLHEQDVLESLHVLISRTTDKSSADTLIESSAASAPGNWEFTNKAQLGIGFRSTQPLANPTNRTIWKRDLSMALYYNLENQGVGAKAGSGGNEVIKQFLQEAAIDPSILATDESAEFLGRQIGITLCGFMLRNEDTLDISQPLSALGLDSLVAVELRNWFRQTFGFEMSVMQVMESPSLVALGKLTAERIMEKYVTPEAHVPVVPGEEWAVERQTKMP